MRTPVVPDFLTVEEAARILRIGRTAAYIQANRWLDTAGSGSRRALATLKATIWLGRHSGRDGLARRGIRCPYLNVRTDSPM